MLGNTTKDIITHVIALIQYTRQVEGIGQFMLRAPRGKCYSKLDFLQQMRAESKGKPETTLTGAYGRMSHVRLTPNSGRLL